MSPSTTLTPAEVAVIRTALDKIDMQVAPLAEAAPRQAGRVAEALDSVRYLLDRAEERRRVH